MKALKSVKKLPRPSIETPRLRVRMKSSYNCNKNPDIDVGRVGKVLLASAVTVTGKEEAGSGRSKSGKMKISQKLNSSTNLNPSPSSLSVSWKDSLRDFKKVTLPVPEKELTKSGSTKARRTRSGVATPSRSSSRLKEREPKRSPGESSASSINLSVIGKFKFNSSLSAPSTSSSPPSTSRFPPRRPTPASSLNLSVVREFRFKPSTSSSTPSDPSSGRRINSSVSRLPLPHRNEGDGGNNHLTPLARSLRAPGDTSSSRSNVSLTNSASSLSRAMGEESMKPDNCSITSIVEGKSKPKNQVRQRGVVLPLLQEKDQVIQDLERKVESLEKEESDQLENRKKVNEELVEEIKELRKKNLENSDKLEQDLYSLEMKNVKILEALEAERAQVEFLQSEVSRLSSDKVESQEELRDSDLPSLVESFVEKVSRICINQNVKLETSSENGNVKLKLKTKKMEVEDSSRLESTHLCENSEICRSKSDELSSSSSSIKVKVSEESFEKNKSVTNEDEAKSMGLSKLSLADPKLESLKVVSRVRTRSMSRKRNPT